MAPKRAARPVRPAAAATAAGARVAAPATRVPILAWITGGLTAAIATWRLVGLRHLAWAQDDAYISFRFARNLLHGHGLVYNVGERVEGYTNFLWTLLSAIPMALGHADPLVWMNGLGLAALGTTVAVLIAFGIVLARHGLGGAAPLAALPLLFTYSFAMWFVSGMEAGLVACFAVVGAVLVALDPQQHRWAPGLASLAGVLAMLTRADAVVVWVALAIVGIGDPWLRTRRVREPLVAWLLPVLVIFLPYTIWRIAYYGSIFPNTYYAKAIYLPAWDRGWTYVTTFFSVYPIAPLLIVPPVAAAMTRDSRARRFLLASSLITALTLLYVLRVGGDFMEWRFLVAMIGVLLPAIVLGVAAIAGRFSRIGGTIAGIAAALGLAAVMQLHLPAAMRTAMDGQEVVPELARYCDDQVFNWRGVGRRLAQLIPAGTWIATGAAGLIPFECDRPILDQHGLVDREIAHEPLTSRTRGRVGHEHYVRDFDELRRRGAAVELVWGVPTSAPEATTLRLPAGLIWVSARIADGRWTSFVVLDSTRLSLAPLRRDPDVRVAVGRDSTVVLHWK